MLGFASITAVVGSLGYAGLSAAGIASGLTVLGGLVGGGMAIGIAVAAVLPVAGLGAGYLFIKGVKEIFTQIQLDEERYDPFWEKPLEETA